MTNSKRGEEPAAWRDALAGPPAALRFAVVIPALNEAAQLQGCLAGLREQGPIDVVVADGGSTDATVAIAESNGARVVTVLPPRRSRQMNAGAAAAATGRPDALVFVSADCRLPAHALRTVERLLVTRPRLVGGSFSLTLCDDRVQPPHSNGRRLRFMSAFSNAYCARTRTLMCDRAIFVRRTAFERLGGFRELAVMEDVDLGRRLRDLGETVVLWAPAVSSSARRLVGPGGWFTGARILGACGAYACGLSADGLVRRLYQPRGGRR